MAKLPLLGGCQCGAVRYRVTKAPLMIYNCHCTNCQKISGAAFGTAATIVEDSFEITEGTPKRVAWTSDVGSERYGLFCGDCGNRIVHGMTPSRGVLSLRCGTFDDTSWVKPVGDIWQSSAQSWAAGISGGLQFDRQPEDYSGMVAAYLAQAEF